MALGGCGVKLGGHPKDIVEMRTQLCLALSQAASFVPQPHYLAQMLLLLRLVVAIEGGEPVDLGLKRLDAGVCLAEEGVLGLRSVPLPVDQSRHHVAKRLPLSRRLVVVSQDLLGKHDLRSQLTHRVPQSGVLANRAVHDPGDLAFQLTDSPRLVVHLKYPQTLLFVQTRLQL